MEQINKEKAKVPAIRFKGFNDAWEQRRLGKIAEFINGRAYSQDELLSEGTYPVLRVGNFYTNDSWYFSDLELENKYYTEKGDLLYTWSATFGPHIWNGPKVIYHYHIWKVVLSDLLNKKFTVQLLEQDKAKALADKNGSTMVHITKDGMEKKKIKIPASMEEQRKIGSFLDNFDHLITLHQRKCDQLKNVKKSLLEKMFSKDGEVYPDVRFKNFTDAWEQRKFEDIAARSSTLSSKSSLPRVEYEDIISGMGQLNKDVFAKDSDKTGFVFHKGDILYGKLRPYLQNWFLSTFKGLAVGDFWVLQPKNVDNNFLYRLIQSHQFDEVANQSTGTKMPRADWKLVSKTEFFIPNTIDEQAAIGTYFKQLDRLITLHQRKVEQLKKIKSALLGKMFV